MAQTLGAMAPSGGIAVLIPLVFANAGNGTCLLYLVVIAAYALLMVNINAFTSRAASSGAFATYAELALGSWAGVLAGWTYLIALVFAVASAAPSVAFYAAQVANSAGLAIPPVFSAVLVAAVVALAWWAAVRGIRLSTDLMLTVECFALGTMVSLAVLFMIHSGRWIDADQLHLVGCKPEGMRLGLILALMSLTGFESVTTLGEESKQALRAIPRAIVTCVIPAGLLFFAMSYVIVAAFKGSGIDLGRCLIPFDYIGKVAGWPRLGALVGVGITLSFFACTLGCLNAAARMLYSLARRGQIWPVLGTVHPRNATPQAAVIACSLVGGCVPIGVLMSGVQLEDCVAYLDQVCSLGFVATYVWVCFAAPFYLKKMAALRWHHVLSSIAALGIFGFALVASVYPAPAAPWNILPYVFAGATGAGALLTWIYGLLTIPDKAAKAT